MKTKIVKENNIEIAVINSSEVLLIDFQSALDFMATIKYETGAIV